MSTNQMDDKINTLLEVVAKQRAELVHLEQKVKTGWKTKCCGVLNGRTVNLATLSQVEVVELLAEILHKAEYLNQAKNLLKVADSETKVFGHVLNDWKMDCEKRIAMLILNDKKEKLQQLEYQLNTLLSPELQIQIRLQSLKGTALEDVVRQAIFQATKQ